MASTKASGILLVSPDKRFRQELANRLGEEEFRLTTAETVAIASAVSQAGQIAVVMLDFQAVTTAELLSGDGPMPEGLTLDEWFSVKRQTGDSWNIREHFPDFAGESIWIALLKSTDVRSVLCLLEAGFDAAVARQADRATLVGLLNAASERRSLDLRAISLESIVKAQILAIHWLQPRSPMQRALADVLLTFCHDTSGYLAAIRGNFWMLKEADAEVGSIDRYVDRIHRVVERLHDNLSEFREVTRSFIHYEHIPSLTTVTLAELDHLVRRLIESSHCEGKVSVTSRADVGATQLQLPTILAQHILGPLVNNSIEAMKSGGELLLSVIAPVPPFDVEITIEDTGPGWGEQLAHFRLAVQLPLLSPVTTDRPFRGFGLRHVRRLLDQLGGGLVLEARPDGGARVRIILPRAVFNE